MSTLADPAVREALSARLSRLSASTTAVWGRMSAHQMICHLNDSFAAGTGARYTSPASNFLQRTLVKWIALRTPVKWPQGVPTRPEVEQGVGGTPPVEWGSDCANLRKSIQEFAALEQFGPHPVFGAMSRRDWMAWGYRHVDHHLRQFGV